MDITSLYYFSELTKDMHMTRTANRLHISQQTLSNHIRRLEECYGTCLLYRKPTLSLTYAGELVLRFAQTVSKENANVMDILADINCMERGLIRIGASPTRAANAFPEILPKFFACYPKIEVRFIDGISSVLEPMVLNGELDFALVLSDEHNVNLVVEHLLTDQVYLCVSDRLLEAYYGSGARELKEKAIHRAYVEDFIEIPFSLLSNKLGKEIHNCFEDAECKPNVIFTGTYTQLMIPFCSQGLSACFITRMNLVRLRDQIADDVNIFPLYFRDSPMFQELSLIRRRERYLSNYAKHFLEILFQAFADMERAQLERAV